MHPPIAKHYLHKNEINFSAQLRLFNVRSFEEAVKTTREEWIVWEGSEMKQMCGMKWCPLKHFRDDAMTVRSEMQSECSEPFDTERPFHLSHARPWQVDPEHLTYIYWMGPSNCSENSLVLFVFFCFFFLFWPLTQLFFSGRLSQFCTRNFKHNIKTLVSQRESGGMARLTSDANHGHTRTRKRRTKMGISIERL